MSKKDLNPLPQGHDFFPPKFIQVLKFAFSVGHVTSKLKDQNLLHRVDTIGNIFTSGAATSENITDGVHKMK